MNMTLQSGQREIVRISMALLIKQCEKAKKLEEALRLSTAEVDALLSRAGLVLDAVAGKASEPVHLTFALRMTLRQGLAMYAAEVGGTIEDELKLAIDTDASTAKIEEIKALAALIAEQRSFADEVADHLRENADEISEELSRGLPEGTTATLTVHR